MSLTRGCTRSPSAEVHTERSERGSGAGDQTGGSACEFTGHSAFPANPGAKLKRLLSKNMLNLMTIFGKSGLFQFFSRGRQRLCL